MYQVVITARKKKKKKEKEKKRKFKEYMGHCTISDHNKLWKILQGMGIPDHLICLMRNLNASQDATELDMEKLTGSKLGKEYVKAVYCHPAYLTYMQSTSCKMLGWMKHKMESRLPGEISITPDTHMTPPLWQKAKRN